MDRITESLLTDFSQDHEISAYAESTRFEHFASFITVRRQHGENFDTSDIVVGSGGDTGIDAIAIIVNGTIFRDVEAFIEYANRSNSLDVQFIFVQAETSASFDSSKIGQFEYGVLDFFSSNPKLIRNDAVAGASSVMAEIYNKSGKFKRGNPVCRLFYVTTGRWQNDPHLEARRKSCVDALSTTGLFREVEFYCLGSSDVQRLYNQTRRSISKEFQFSERAVIPEIPGVSEAYLGFIPADSFLNIVCDENGDIIKTLFYDNVRDWENYNPVNTEIAETLTSDDKARFVLMNNGVTIIAKTIRPTGNKFYIEDFQIVNGCQTTHVLADNKSHINESVMIPLRLIGTQDDNVRADIIKATNRQTEVKKEQFFALTEFAKKIEQFFQTFDEPKRLYYERRSNQFDTQNVQNTRIVTPGNLIRAFAAMFLEEPHATTRSYGSLIERVGKDIFNEDHKLDPYYVAAFALYKLEYAFRAQKVDPIYKPARFHLLLVARLLAGGAGLPPLNSREMERYCRKILEKLWDPESADSLFFKSSFIVNRLSEGKLNRDNIRTLPFTDTVLKGWSTAYEEFRSLFEFGS